MLISTGTGANLISEASFRSTCAQLASSPASPPSDPSRIPRWISTMRADSIETRSLSRLSLIRGSGLSSRSAISHARSSRTSHVLITL